MSRWFLCRSGALACLVRAGSDRDARRAAADALPGRASRDLVVMEVLDSDVFRLPAAQRD